MDITISNPGGIKLGNTEEAIEVSSSRKSTIHVSEVNLCTCNMNKIYCDKSCFGKKHNIQIVNKKPFQL